MDKYDCTFAIAIAFVVIGAIIGVMWLGGHPSIFSGEGVVYEKELRPPYTTETLVTVDPNGDTTQHTVTSNHPERYIIRMIDGNKNRIELSVRAKEGFDAIKIKERYFFREGKLHTSEEESSNGKDAERVESKTKGEVMQSAEVD